MKKIFLSSLAVFIATICSFSQLNTGSFFASGTAGIDLEIYSQKQVDSDDKVNYFKFMFNPKAGYFLKNKIGVGIALDSRISRNKGTNTAGFEYTSSYSSLLVGPFGRYYYEYGDLIPFGEVFVGFGKTNDKSESEGFDSEFPHSVFKMTGGAGAAYFINETVALEAIIKYFWEKQKPSWENATGEGEIYSGVIFMLGLAIYFGSI